MQYTKGEKVTYFYVNMPLITKHVATILDYLDKEQMYSITYSYQGKKIKTKTEPNNLIVHEELMKPAHWINEHGKPHGYNYIDVGLLIFTNTIELFIGTINSVGQWKDIPTNTYIEDVTHWMYLDRRTNEFQNPIDFLEDPELSGLV